MMAPRTPIPAAKTANAVDWLPAEGNMAGETAQVVLGAAGEVVGGTAGSHEGRGTTSPAAV
jgi:hypothetical protein